MRTFAIIAFVSIVGCSKSDRREPSAGSASPVAPTPAPVPKQAVEPAPDSAAGPPPAAAPSAFDLGKPCVRFAELAKRFAIDDEMSVETTTTFDVDADGKDDTIVSIQWKADIRSHLFVHVTDGCGVPAGTVVGSVEEVQPGSPIKLSTGGPEAHQYELVAGRFAEGDATAPLVVDALRYLDDGVAAPDLPAVSKQLDRHALTTAGSEFASVADFASRSTFVRAAKTLREIKLARKGASAPEIAALEKALRATADALDRAAPLIESKPGEAWAMLQPAAADAYKSARSLFEHLATTNE